MLSELPKLLGKGFLVGFVLPTVAFFAFVVFALGYPAGRGGPAAKLLTDWDKAGPLLLCIVFTAVLLLALNRSIVRLFEGYPIDALFKWIGRRGRAGAAVHEWYVCCKRRRFEQDIEPVLREFEWLDDDPEAQPRIADFERHAREAACHFPHAAAFVLPTRFGNTMRAGEVYSHVVYGIEAIECWDRLTLILPQAVLDRIQDGRMLLDFFVNSVVLSMAAIAMVICAMGKEWSVLWWLIPTVAALIFAWVNLTSGALQWSSSIKSVFDLYRGALAKQMGLDLPLDPFRERAMWGAVSRMMLYRWAGAYNELAPLRIRTPPADTEKDKDKDKEKT